MKENFAFIDIETTSLDRDEAHIIEVAILLSKDNGEIDEFQTLIKPPSPIPPHIFELTGISNKMCKNKPEFYEVSQRIYDMLAGKRIIAHNVNYDYEILQKHFAKLGINFKCEKACTLALSKNFIPGLKSYRLKSLCEFFSLKMTEHHRALSDARATKDLYQILKTTYYPRKGKETILHPYFKDIEKNISSLPCAIKYNNRTSIFDNSKNGLYELFELTSKNTENYSSPESVILKEYASYVEARLKTYKNKKPKWVIYQSKNSKENKLLIGKFNPKKRALFFFNKKDEAKYFLGIKDIIFKSKNIKISSLKKLDGKYTHIYVKDFKYIAIVKTKSKTLKEVPIRLYWQSLNVIERTQLHIALFKIKKQIIKTDLVLEASIKELDRSFLSNRKSDQAHPNKNDINRKCHFNRKSLSNYTDSPVTQAQ